jgi:hypothetical protein
MRKLMPSFNLNPYWTDFFLDMGHFGRIETQIFKKVVERAFFSRGKSLVLLESLLRKCPICGHIGYLFLYANIGYFCLCESLVLIWVTCVNLRHLYAHEQFVVMWVTTDHVRHFYSFESLVYMWVTCAHLSHLSAHESLVIMWVSMCSRETLVLTWDTCAHLSHMLTWTSFAQESSLFFL